MQAAAELANPIRSSLNARLYIYVAINSEYPLGPPAVMIQIRSKYFRDPTIDSTAEVFIVPASNGRVILQNCCHLDAPSIVAAS